MGEEIVVLVQDGVSLANAEEGAKTPLLSPGLEGWPSQAVDNGGDTGILPPVTVDETGGEALDTLQLVNVPL